MSTLRGAKPGRTGVITVYLLIFAQIARTLTDDGTASQFPWYVGLILAHLVLFTAGMLRPNLPAGLAHLYLIVQSAIILVMLSLNPDIDHVIAFFLPLSYQVALLFAGQTLWKWIGGFIVLMSGSLVFYHGALHGLALALSTIAATIVIPAFVVVNGEIEQARAKSEAMLKQLQATNARLQAYANQVDELAAMEERNRLARELHDSVSQTMFAIVLNVRTTRILLERNPAEVRSALQQLQGLTQDALAHMRSLIAELRPSHD